MIIKHNLNTAETKSLASTKGMKKYIVLEKGKCITDYYLKTFLLESSLSWPSASLTLALRSSVDIWRF